jgi:hypothetical protein
MSGSPIRGCVPKSFPGGRHRPSDRAHGSVASVIRDPPSRKDMVQSMASVPIRAGDATQGPRQHLHVDCEKSEAQRSDRQLGRVLLISRDLVKPGLAAASFVLFVLQIIAGMTRGSHIRQPFCAHSQLRLLSMRGRVHTIFGRANVIRFSYLKVYGRLWE